MIGFTDLKGLGRTDFHFLSEPFKNFNLILHNPSFKKALTNTVVIWMLNFIPQILLALLLTAWFTSNRNKIKGQGLFKVLFYMPNIITAASLAILFNSLFGYPIGPVNDLLKFFGFINEPQNFAIQKATSKGVVAFIQFWQWYGYTMIVLISGVLGMNPELFEASEIDGANGIQTFFFVTLPNLRSILLFTLVTSMIGGLQMFDIPKLYLLGGPDSATLTTSVFIYNQAFQGSYLYNKAAAASMIMFVLISILSGVLFYLMRDKYAIQQKKIMKKVAKERKLAEKAAKGVA
jgi:ABC-type sugar transport systems, permease components